MFGPPFLEPHPQWQTLLYIICLNIYHGIHLSSAMERSGRRSPIRRLCPPVGIVAIEGVLSEGYIEWLSGVGLCKPVCNGTFPTNMAEKHGGDIHVFNIAPGDRITLPGACMVPMRLYKVLCGSGLACKPVKHGGSFQNYKIVFTVRSSSVNQIIQ